MNNGNEWDMYHSSPTSHPYTLQINIYLIKIIKIESEFNGFELNFYKNSFIVEPPYLQKHFTYTENKKLISIKNV